MNSDHLDETALISFNHYIVSGIYCLLKLRFKAPEAEGSEREVQLSLTMEQCIQISQNLWTVATVLALERPTAAQ
jgi:hypothetical protein